MARSADHLLVMSPGNLFEFLSNRDLGGAKMAKSAVELKVEGLIYQIRGERVLIDQDLADLYGVETKALTQAVRRNKERFPADFMFQLSDQ